MTLLAITVIGADRPGIIAAVTGALAEVGGNLEDSSMTILRGHFAMTLIAAVGRSVAEVEQAVRAVTGPMGLLATVGEVAEESAAEDSGVPYVLSVHGADRPGIVSRITGVVAAHGGNITDLTTRLTDQMYVVIADVDLPRGVNGTVDVAPLTEQLSGTAEELGVDVVLRPADEDVL